MPRAYSIMYRTSLHVPAHVAHMFQADNQSRVGDPVQVVIDFVLLNFKHLGITMPWHALYM